MRLCVIRAHTERFCNRAKNSELISHRVANLLGRDRQFFPAEVFPVEEARMRTNSNAVVARRFN